VVHANAVLTPRGRLLLARRVVDEGWPIVRAAEHFHVSWPTARRWAARYAAMGAEVATLPLAPKNPLPYRHQLRAVRSLIDGFQELIDAGGPVTPRE
jgi:leucine-zipper of insertion element IS481